jgi:hypothetical protein
MLTDAQIDLIVNKERLTKTDIFLIHDHLDYIKKLETIYVTGLPEDVHESLKKDLRRIMARLQKEREFIAGSKIDVNQKRPINRNLTLINEEE